MHSTLPPEGRGAAQKVVYSMEDLAAARVPLARVPPRRPMRRQLFLNFKGGTGKTSLSTCYAFRLAEMGHRVLVIDLDSQGHATKCLGFEGEDSQKTLLDALIKKTPTRQVIVNTPLPGLDLVPSNLTMSTIDLSLMPLAGARVPAAQRAQGGRGPPTTSSCSTRRPPSGCSTSTR